jgi:predicted RNA-binding Zn ribbon-like protein
MMMVADVVPTKKGSAAVFSFRSDHLALDFAATLMFRELPGQSRELLTGPDALVQWAIAAGLLTEAPRHMSAKSLLHAIEVREAIYRVAQASIAGEPLPADSVARLNHYASKKPAGLALTPDGALNRTGSLEHLVASLARSGIELFGGPNATRVHQCGRPGCTRQFVDRTRGQTRIWCGMRACGNRVNAAAYRRRRARHA